MLPYENGKSYRVLQGYGSRFSHVGLEQYAVDFNMSVGTPVHAARAGVVARIEESSDKGCWDDGCGAYANYIVILHDDGTHAVYAHLNWNSIRVKPGDRVQRGEYIADSGNTGFSSGPHLHFVVLRNAGLRLESVPIEFMGANSKAVVPVTGMSLMAS